MNEELKMELLSMRQKDQEMRKKTIIEGPNVYSPEIDLMNYRRMQEIIEHYGWPGRSLVGDDGTEAAWLIVQHSTNDIDFQMQCLKLIREASESGEIGMHFYAYLEDRINIHQGKKQRFGTQCGQDGEYLFCRELESPDLVDQYRNEMGMDPLRFQMIRILVSSHATRQLGSFIEREQIWPIDIRHNLSKVTISCNGSTLELSIEWDEERKRCRILQ